MTVGYHEKARSYWSNLNATREMFGTYGMGGGGLTEVLYRHYFELRHLMKVVPFYKGMRVIELGCGNGRWAMSLAPRVARYYAVDFSHAAIEFARSEAERLGIANVEFIESSALEVEIPDGLDVVYFSGVLQYLDDQDALALLSRMAPLLNEGAIVIDRSTVNTRERKTVDSGGYFSIYRTHRELEDIFRAAGLSMTYTAKSYMYMRFGGLLRDERRNSRVARLVAAGSPVSFYIIWALSFLAGLLKPRLVEGGEYPHVFSVFKRG